MSNDRHEGCVRGFIWSNKAWYHQPEYGKDIHFGMYAENGGTSGEMSVEWIQLSGIDHPRLMVFNDAWSALSTFTDLLQKMGEVDDFHITQEEFVDMLLSCGFVDMTKYKSPYEPQETTLRLRLDELERERKDILEKLEKLEK